MRISNVLLGVALCVSAQPLVAQYAQPPAQPAADPTADRLEQLLWDGAARSNNADGYQTYLRRYPNGAHSDQARDALDRLYGRPPAQRYPAQQGQQSYPPQAYPQQAYPPQAPAGYPAPYQQAPQSAPAQAYPSEQAAPPAYAPAPQPQPAASPPAAEPMESIGEPPAPPPPAEPAPTMPAPAKPAVPPVAAKTVPVVKHVATGSPLFLCRPVFSGGIAPFEQAGEAEITAYLAALKVNSVTAYKTFLQAHPHGAFSTAVENLIATREGRAKALAATTVPGPSQAKARTPVTIAAADYPEGATQAGAATAIWEVGEDGCVQSCRIEKTSGSPALDGATCRILSARGAYEPARDSAGKPIRSIETGTFSWSPPAH